MHSLQAITEAIRDFPFSNFGLDNVDPDSEDAEWVPALAAAVATALAVPIPARSGQAEASSAPIPDRGDQMEAWLRAQRGKFARHHDVGWDVIDDLLDEYRLHADTRTPLGEHVCEPHCDCRTSGRG